MRSAALIPPNLEVLLEVHRKGTNLFRVRLVLLGVHREGTHIIGVGVVPLQGLGELDVEYQGYADLDQEPAEVCHGQTRLESLQENAVSPANISKTVNIKTNYIRKACRDPRVTHPNQW